MFMKHIDKRIKISLFIFIFLFILITIKVFYIQVIQYDKLNSLANDLWSRNLPIEPNRGNIYDRNGVLLAGNITTTSLVVVPSQIIDKEQVATDIANILEVDYEEIYEHVSKQTSIERIHPEGRQLSYEIADEINALNYDGVYLLKESQRYYPYDTALAHVLGYVGIDNQGLSGIELQYDDYLTGSAGAIQYYSDAKGGRLELSEVYSKPTDGMNIYLTIDYNIQMAMERELDNIVSKYSPDSALMVAMDPDTGEILGMSSRPNFSPSNYQDYDLEEINRNLPIWSTYEPGSTFKIITLAAALNDNKVDLDNDMFFDTGSVQVENANIKCWSTGGHGEQTFLQVVENSCNPGFVELGNRLGKESLFGYVDDFGFGEKTGIDLNGESKGIMFNYDKIGPVELATTSFGQGVAVTPIQQVNAVSAAINGGNLYTPYIVKSFNEPETNSTIHTFLPTLVRQVISEEASSQVRYALESVVTNGTGRPAYIDGYRVGGKTGTAQKVENGSYMVGNYIVSFISFLPADDPEIVLYVAIDNPKGVVQYGGVVAAPVAKTVLEAAIESLEIEERENPTDKNYQVGELHYVEVPNVIGMNTQEAMELLKDFQVEFTGSGSTIFEQQPSAGERILEDSTIRLLLKE